MGALGELLALLHDAGARRGTLRAELRVWRRPRLAQPAWRREADRWGGSVVSVGRGEPPAEEERELVRLWFAPPDRVREERETAEGVERAVRVGARWWRVDARGDGVSNEEDLSVGSGVGERFGWLADPGGLLGALVFTPQRTGQVAGRTTLHARAVPRAGGDTHPVWLPGAGGADEYLLDVDAEHGVLLRVEARLDGAPFLVHEVAQIAFGEALAPELFSLTPPAASTLRGVRERFPSILHHIPIERLAALAPFPVWIPARLPRGWTLRATFLPASERHDLPAHVQLVYAPEDATHALWISERPAGHVGELEEEEDYARGGPWRAQERGGRALELREPVEDWQPAQVRLELEGTRVLLQSPDLDAGWLAALAAGLVRAPTVPPALAYG